MPRSARVALLIGTTSGYDRDLLSGIGAYVGQHGPWRLHPFGHRLDTSGIEILGSLKRWRGDGLLASVGSGHEVIALAKLDTPTVFIGHFKLPRGERPVPQVGTAVAEGSRLALEHLLDAGLRSLAYVGLANVFGSELRRDTFLNAAERAGLDAPSIHDLRSTTRDVEHEIARLNEWLRQLPKPVGIFAVSDQAAVLTTVAAIEAGLELPREVAVLGTSNDEALCEFIHPRLSSLDTNLYHVGYASAQLLDRLMDGEKPPTVPIMVSPIGIIERESTRVHHVDDVDVAAALDFIRAHANEGIEAVDVAEASALGRSSLERRFRLLRRRTLAEEIRNVRLEQAKTLLRETDLPLVEIVERCGFNFASGFTRTFRTYVGMVPSAYRQKTRRG